MEDILRILSSIRTTSAAEKEFLGTIVISDTVKPEAKRAIAQLKQSGVKKTVMLTGDRKDVGEAVAESLGIDEVYTDLLPGTVHGSYSTPFSSISFAFPA